MSVHDETWDKCSKCNQTIKTFHGDYHDSGACSLYKTWYEWNDTFKPIGEVDLSPIFKNMKAKSKNNITTGGYFLNRLRDSGFIAIRLFKDYPIHDPRKWTIMVDPSGHSLMITCYVNKEGPGDVYFEFNDGGNKFLNNYKLKTQSMEIIITTLIEKGVPQKQDNSNYTKSD